jgi:hypothetical protein
MPTPATAAAASRSPLLECSGPATRNDVNYLGAFSGLMAQSPSDASPEEGPLPGDLETARRFGARIAGTAHAIKQAKEMETA